MGLWTWNVCSPQVMVRSDPLPEVRSLGMDDISIRTYKCEDDSYSLRDWVCSAWAF